MLISLLLPQFTQSQSTVLSGLGATLESYHKLQQKPKTGGLTGKSNIIPTNIQTN